MNIKINGKNIFFALMNDKKGENEEKIIVHIYTQKHAPFQASNNATVCIHPHPTPLTSNRIHGESYWKLFYWNYEQEPFWGHLDSKFLNVFLNKLHSSMHYKSGCSSFYRDI